MMHDKNSMFRFGLAVLMLGGAIFITEASLPATVAQDAAVKPAASKNRSYNSGRDPFKKYEARLAARKATGQVGPPSIQQRIEQYKAQKLAAMNARKPAPKPTTALLLSEVQVIGISRTPRGYAAIIEATPIKLTYVIYPGETFFDGQLVAIEDTRLVFRHEAVFADGRRTRSVEMKSLRAVNTVGPMSVSKSAETAPAVEAAKQDDEKSVATAKP